MSIHWLLNKGFLEDENHIDVLTELKRSNIPHTVADNHIFFKSDGKLNDVLGIDKDKPLMTLGSIPFVRSCLVAMKSNPFGGYFNHKEVDIINSFSNFSDDLNLLFNKDQSFNYFGYIEKNIDYFLDEYYGSFFIRPNSSLKTFIPAVINRENYAIELNCIRNLYGTLDNELCFISEKKDILNEYRFIIANREVIASSSYILSGEINAKVGASEQAINLANEMAKKDWQPDDVYIVDIGENHNKVGILEFNCYSTSGLYKCDPRHIGIVNEIIKAELKTIY